MLLRGELEELQGECLRRRFAVSIAKHRNTAVAGGLDCDVARKSCVHSVLGEPQSFPATPDFPGHPDRMGGVYAEELAMRELNGFCSAFAYLEGADMGLDEACHVVSGRPQSRRHFVNRLAFGIVTLRAERAWVVAEGARCMAHPERLRDHFGKEIRIRLLADLDRRVAGQDVAKVRHSHARYSTGPVTRVTRIVMLLCCSGLPLLFGVVFAPIGIYHLAQGVPYMAPMGWIFTVMGVIMAIVGVVAAVVLWPKRETPASQDGDGASP